MGSEGGEGGEKGIDLIQKCSQVLFIWSGCGENCKVILIVNGSLKKRKDCLIFKYIQQQEEEAEEEGRDSDGIQT